MGCNVHSGLYELSETTIAFREGFEIKTDGETMQIVLTTHHEKLYNSQLNQDLGSTEKRYRV